MRLFVHISCSTDEAEQNAHQFCLNAIQNDHHIYRLFFSGKVVASALKPNSKWIELCHSKQLDGVCCSHSVEEYKYLLSSPLLKKSSIDPGGLALLIDAAIKSDIVVNFNDSGSTPDLALELQKKHQLADYRPRIAKEEECILGLCISKNPNTLQSKSRNKNTQRLRRLFDTAAVFCVFEQKFTILLDIFILLEVNKKIIIEGLKALGEQGLKKVSFYSAIEFEHEGTHLHDGPIEQPNTDLLDSLSFVANQLKDDCINCQAISYSQKENIYLKHKPITF